MRVPTQDCTNQASLKEESRRKERGPVSRPVLSARQLLMPPKPAKISARPLRDFRVASLPNAGRLYLVRFRVGLMMQRGHSRLFESKGPVMGLARNSEPGATGANCNRKTPR